MLEGIWVGKRKGKTDGGWEEEGEVLRDGWRLLSQLEGGLVGKRKGQKRWIMGLS